MKIYVLGMDSRLIVDDFLKEVRPIFKKRNIQEIPLATTAGKSDFSKDSKFEYYASVEDFFRVPKATWYANGDHLFGVSLDAIEFALNSKESSFLALDYWGALLVKNLFPENVVAFCVPLGVSTEGFVSNHQSLFDEILPYPISLEKLPQFKRKFSEPIDYSKR